MYGLCLIGDDECRWLARDGFGIKPLYYWEKGETLLFASEPRALFAGGASKALSKAHAEELLALGYTIGEGSIFKAVTRLAPGRTLSFRTGPSQAEPGQLGQARLSQAPHGFDCVVAAVMALDAVLQDCVTGLQRSDVPYGLVLSGGVDSASIATLMSRLYL